MAYDPEVTDARYPTITDVLAAVDPQGKIAKLGELLNQTNPFLEDMVMVESNLADGNRMSIRADLPEPTWRILNYGVKPTKSRRSVIKDTMGMLEEYSEVDAKLAELNGNSVEWRLSEDLAAIEGMNQSMATTVLYGDLTDHPERFTGIMPRYANLGTPANKPTAQTSGMLNVISGGGSSNLCSALLIGWGKETVFGLYPKGSKAGLEVTDKGKQTLFDSDGGRFEGYRTHYKWELGLGVKDWRYVVRVANIDYTATLDHKLLIKAMNTIPSGSLGRLVWYMPKALKSQLDIAACDKANIALTIDDSFGRPVTKFWGVPIRPCDAMLLTESALT